MKKLLLELQETLKERLSENNKIFSEVMFFAYAYRAILTIINHELPEEKQQSFDPIEELSRWTVLTACFFVSMPIINYEGSFSMVYSYYQTYSLFDTDELLKILSNKSNLFYDSSYEALLAIVLALYTSVAEETAEELLSNSLK